MLSVPTLDEIFTHNDDMAIQYQIAKTTPGIDSGFTKRMRDRQNDLIELRHMPKMDAETKRRADLVLAGKYTGRPV